MFSGGKKYIERIRCFLILILENLMLYRQVQKPANEWEWYICTELHDRLRSSSYAALHLGFMSIPRLGPAFLYTSVMDQTLYGFS
jgi:hypothetical protein